LIATELMDKADRAAASATLLLDAGDFDGACNRAYYAMFDAARAALIGCGVPADQAVAKTHSGLIAAFGLHLVKTGRLPADLGKALNRASEVRLAADYTGDVIDAAQARRVVEQAGAFIAAIRRELGRPRGGG
jgi:uncharacterized protein (UPF0332 family)